MRRLSNILNIVLAVELALFVSLVAAIASADAPAVVSPPQAVPRIEAEGFVRVHGTDNPFLVGWHMIDLCTQPDGGNMLHQCVFAAEADYREALRRDGHPVRLRGFVVRRGNCPLLVVEEVQGIVRQ